MEIINAFQNEAALEVISLLMDGDPEANSQEGIALRVLADAIEIYESKGKN